MIDDLKNKKDPKIDKLIDYFNLKKEKWIKLSQDAVYETLKLFPQKLNYDKNSIKNILENFRIDKNLIRYDEDEEDFT